MFWNTEFLNASHIEVLIQAPDMKLSDVLFHDDLLQELKTSNFMVAKYLNRPQVIAQLLDNITRLAEQDCCDKSLYSKVHAAYQSCEVLTIGSSELFDTLMEIPNALNRILFCLIDNEDGSKSLEDILKTRVVPQKATLISKLISTIHSSEAVSLCCHISKNIDSFGKLIELLVENIDISGSFEILSTFIKPTKPVESRFAFCEILSNLKFVSKLIDVMTLSDNEDKQRNACQLLCDITATGRQVIAEPQEEPHTSCQDMLAEVLESTPAIKTILTQMFSNDKTNSTAIVCGMKVLQSILAENSFNRSKKPGEAQQQQQQSENDTDESSTELGQRDKETIEETTAEVIEQHLIKFHELLLNPPKQEPIKTTFGVIQKPLGYMRLEVVNLLRALIRTNSPKIISKLVDLKTMKVIIDLFIDYSWNNLLHTQVEQALCLIIKNYRSDEDRDYMSEEKDETPKAEVPSRALLSQLLNECDLIGRLLLPDNSKRGSRNSEQANFGHIIQMINSIAINRDLDVINQHLDEMKEKRPELHERWTTFVNVDVASFKEITLYYDAQSASNNISRRFADTEREKQLSFLESDDEIRQYIFYVSFKSENVLPSINVDVTPRSRRPVQNHILRG